MNRRQISALLILKNLGIKHQMESFEERLSVQKSIYLAQAAGADLGHYFNWYLRGPYSSSVTEDVFDAVQNYDAADVIGSWELDPATHQKLSTLRASFEPPEGLTEPEWLELLASIHFLIDRKQVPTTDPERLCEHLKKYDKMFTQEQVSEALRRLRSTHLLNV